MRQDLSGFPLSPADRKRAVYALVAVFCSMFLAVAASVLYANHVGRVSDRKAEESQRKICGIISTIDDAYQSTPPSTPTGRRLADEIHRYRQSLNCP